MWGGFLVVVVWAAVWVWAGRGLLLTEGRAADRRALVCGVVGCLVLGVGNTPVVLLLPACVGSGVWWVPLRVWGWHAVGVLGQCALVAWPAFSASLFVGGVGVGVGGLVVNCIVDASILL